MSWLQKAFLAQTNGGRSGERAAVPLRNSDRRQDSIRHSRERSPSAHTNRVRRHRAGQGRLPRTPRNHVARVDCAGRPLRPSPVAQITWLYAHGGADAGARHRRNYGDLHAGAAGDAAIAAGQQAGSALAYRRPGPLLQLGWIQPGHDDDAPGDWNLFPYEAYKLFRANTTGFQDLAAFQAGNQPLAVRRAGSPGPTETANGEFVSGNFFQTLGVSAWRGRLLIDADDQEGAPPVAVMSFHAWQEKYGSDPSVVGSTYQINGRAFTIIGVAPAGFVGATIVDWGMPDIWLPLRRSRCCWGNGTN